MAFLHKEEGDHSHTYEKKEYGSKDKYSSEPQKAGEFIIVAKFGGHAFRHLASRLANLIRQGGRRTKKNNFLKNFSYLSFYNFCTVLCIIYNIYIYFKFIY